MSSHQVQGCLAGLEVADHPSVDDRCQVAAEDAHSLLSGVSAPLGVIADALRPLIAAQLGDRHAVEDGVDLPVTTTVEPMTYWLP